MDYNRLPSWWFNGVSPTCLGLLSQPVTELKYNAGTAGNRDYKGNRWTRGRQRERFLFPRVFLFL
jgi:hypothetical protein